MKDKDILKKIENSSILILGLGREGLSSYQFLRKKFPNKTIALADENPKNKLVENFQKIIKKDKNLELHLGKKYLDKLGDYQLIFKTAGIAISNPKIQKAIKKGSEISSNTEVFFQLCPAKIIGITGTKGKSTTSSLIYQILKDAKLDTVLLGNIGIAALSYLDKIKKKTLVVFELSCHQLAELKMSPEIAVIQDVKPEHLDYYKTFKKYFEAKTAISKYQKENDLLIYNPNLSGASDLAKLSKAQKLTHNLTNKKANVFLKNDYIYYQKRRGLFAARKIIKKTDIPLVGDHNLYNVMPAILLAKTLNISSESIKRSIKKFKTLSHRLELVANIDGVKYYDDSIATNPFASIMAIRSFPKNSITLIAGGHERNQDFAELAQVILEQEIKKLILFPTTGTRILKEVEKANKKHKQKIETKIVKSMKEAVKAVKEDSKKGDIVLLSPASASFGLFTNYRDRGQQFIKEVKKLK